MTDFDNLMDQILDFIDHAPTEDLLQDIRVTADKQRSFQSSHEYDLEKFGLNAEQIKSGWAPVYATFLNTTPGS